MRLIWCAHVARCITPAPRVAILRSAFVPLVIPFSPANKSLSIPRAASRNLPGVTAAPKLCAPRRKLSSAVRHSPAANAFSAADTAAITPLVDLNSLIQLKRERFEQLEREIADPRLVDNRKHAAERMRAPAGLKGAV